MKTLRLSLPLLVAVFVTIKAVPSNDALDQEWEAFKVTYQRNYNSEVEEKFRRMIFTDNWHKINRHNKKFERGEVSFTMGMNRFGDWLHHERVSILHGYRRYQDDDTTNSTSFMVPENVEVPGAIDWVKKGYVTAVKNQGDCGSCWSFSATGALEGQHKRKTGKLVSLSEQNLVDCSDKNKGCEGGVVVYAFQYIKKNKGIDTEKSYPYEAKEGKCRFKRSNVGATDTGFSIIKSGSETKLKQAVGTVGPVAVAIDASPDSFSFYSGGVYDEPNCSSEDLTHGVLAVGYDTDNGKAYWKVKNSWGEGWGEKGYIRMSRNKKNQCGIATQACYPLV